MDQIIAHLPGIFLAWSAFFLTSASPGPANLATMATSMTAGRHAGLAQASGVVATSFFWGLMAAVGLGALLEQYAFAIIALKLLGGAYLLWLAFKSFRSATRKPHFETGSRPKSASSNLPGFFYKGVLVHLTNPKPIFGWMATIALAASDNTPLAVYAIVVVSCTITSLTINITYALSFSSGTVTHFYAKFHHWFEVTFGTMFLAAGVKLLASARQN